MKPTIKLGLLVDSPLLPAWVMQALRPLAALPHVEWKQVFLTERSPSSSEAAFPLLYRVYDRLDRKLFSSQPDAFAMQPLDSLLPSISQTQWGLQHNHRSIATLDILLNLSSVSLPDAFTLVSTCAVWQYHFGDPAQSYREPAGFWEVMENDPETHAALTAAINGKTFILDYAIYQTYPFSPNRSRSFCAWSAAAMLPRQIERFYQLGSDAFYSSACKKPPPAADKTRTAPPQLTNARMLKLICRLGSKLIKRTIQKACCRDQWQLAYTFDPQPTIDPAAFHKIIPPRERMWADPHSIFHEGKYFVFIEEYPFRTGRGELAVLELKPDGSHTQPVTILQKPYHLSYPHVFRWQDQYYMIPESAENKTIDLYACTEFPYRWEHKQTLMKDVLAVDTSLHYDGSRWYLFTALSANEGAFPQTELHLFHAPDLFTDQWQPHPLNPLCSDMKNARPAGAIFQQNGKLFRPSQDCTGIYGYGFNLNQIDVLSPTHYHETLVTAIKPLWDPSIHATHTFARVNTLTMIDCLSRRWKFW